MTGALSTLLELTGLAAVLMAAYFVDWRLALAVFGAVLIVIAYFMDSPEPRRVGTGGRTDG